MSYDLTQLPKIAAGLTAIERECLVTLALKITDDTCKMDTDERDVFMRLYDTFDSIETSYFDAIVFELIAQGRSSPTSAITAKIKPYRTSGMDHIGRDAMKAFKAAVRSRLIKK